MKVLLALAALSLLGCDRVFGLTGRDDDGGVEEDMLEPGMTIEVTGTWKRIDVFNDADTTPSPVAGILTDADQLTVTSFGQSIPVQLNRDDGTFTFTSPTPYEVRAGATEWQSSSPTLLLEDVRFGRPTAALSTQASITATITPWSSSGERVLVSTGVWSLQTVLPNSEGKFTAGWAAGSIFGAAPRLVDVTAGDTLQLVTYRLMPNTGQTVLVESAPASIQMTDGENVLELVSSTTNNSGCARVVSSVGADLERLSSALPDFTSAIGGWEIVAVPAVELYGVRIPLLLANYYPDDPAGQASDVTFPNPFIGHAPTLVQNSIVSRTLASGGSNLSASITHQMQFTPEITVPCNKLELQAVSIGIPHAPKLANIALETDDLVIAVPERDFVDLMWSNTEGVEPEAYFVSLGVADGTAVEFVHTITTIQPRARLSTSLFEPGKRYVLRVIAGKSSVPRAEGDFSSGRLPASFASSTSASFFVAR